MRDASIERRKRSHLDLCASGDVEHLDKTTLFEEVDFVHDSLSEIDLADVDLSVEIPRPQARRAVPDHRHDGRHRGRRRRQPRPRAPGGAIPHRFRPRQPARDAAPSGARLDVLREARSAFHAAARQPRPQPGGSDGDRGDPSLGRRRRRRRALPASQSRAGAGAEGRRPRSSPAASPRSSASSPSSASR